VVPRCCGRSEAARWAHAIGEKGQDRPSAYLPRDYDVPNESGRGGTGDTEPNSPNNVART
jgi:hypothetical protein